MLEANKAVALSFVTALGKGDVSGVTAVISEDIEAIATGTCLLSGTRSHADICSAAGLLGLMTKGGIEFKILAVTAEADRVAVECEGRSTLVTGQAYNNQYHFLFFIRDGKIVRIKEYFDTLLTENLLGPLVPKAA